METYKLLESPPENPGVEQIGGDMFTSVTEADALMLKRVCHNWDDEHCLKMVKNCKKALPKGGKVIVMDYIRPVIPDPTDPADKFVLGVDNMMLIQTGGKERTEQEFEALCKASGFSDFRVVCNAYAMWVMEFHN